MTLTGAAFLRSEPPVSVFVARDRQELHACRFQAGEAGGGGSFRLYHTAWPFETEGLKQHGATYTNPDGTPDQVKIFRSDYYDGVGVDRVMSMGSILGAPAVGWERGFCRKCGRKRLFVDVKNVKFVK